MARETRILLTNPAAKAGVSRWNRGLLFSVSCDMPGSVAARRTI
ncbi:hypothetical protein [Allosalinactinospora lopnorensis]|nr:hypothetical protein [Allosalinactinospora lopnorensis]